MFNILVFLLTLLASPAIAQTCPTRPAGDNSNACASTAFVRNISNLPAIAANSILGNNTGSTAVPTALHVGTGVVAALNNNTNSSGGILVYGAPSTAINFTGSGTGAVTRTLAAKLWEYVSATDYATCNGSVDDSANLLKAAQALGTAGGSVYIPPGVKCLVDTNLTLPNNIYLIGPYNFVGSPSVASVASAYGSMGALLINSVATVKIGSNGGIRGLLAYRKGMTFPAADSTAFAGTAFTANGDSISIDHSMILGFSLGYYSTGFNRFTSDHLNLDTVNGVEMINNQDFARFYGAHYWPFSRMPAGTLTTTGTAFNFHDTVDGLDFTNGFSYGAAVGLQLSNVNSWAVDNFWADNIPARSGTNGIVLSGDNYGGTLHNPRSSNNQNGIYMNVTAGIGVAMVGGDVWGNNQVGVYLQSGDLMVSGGASFRAAGGTGIYVNDNVSNLIVDGVRFSGLTNVILPNASTSNIRFTPNNVIIGADGTVAANGNMIVPTVTPAAGVAALPPNGNIFKFARGDGAGLSTLSGGWAGRRITLIFGSGGLPGLITSAATPSTNQIRLAGPNAAGVSWAPSIAGSTLVIEHDGTQWFEVGRSGAPNAPQTKTANYTVDSGGGTDYSIIFNGSATITVTLPSAASYPGRRLNLRTIAAFTVVSASSNVIPFIGGAAGTAILAATAGKWGILESDGTNWQTMEGN
jgi:hypothetical protein